MWRFICFSIVLLAVVGCGSKNSPSVVVTGSVTYKGKPVNGAALMLYSTKGKGESFIVPVSQDGTFRSTDVPEGEYKVVVQPAAGFTPHMPKDMDAAKLAANKSKIEEFKNQSPPTIPIPEKYKQNLTTDLKMTIAKGEQTINLELNDTPASK